MKLPIKVSCVELAKSSSNKETNPELELTKYEEYTTLWLWAYPELLGWKNDIKWLFSPVTGNSNFPGDLWGIDSKGNLIIVEVKSAKNNKLQNKLQDPFIDFIGFESHRKTFRIDCFNAKTLETRWSRLLKCEQLFLKDFLSDFRKRVHKKRTAPGVVPYSSKRAVVNRWPFLYSNKISRNFIAGSNYIKTIPKYLSERSANMHSSQYYFGVIGTPPNIHPKLSHNGKSNYDKLCAEIGKDRIHLVAINAKILKNGAVQLEAIELKHDS